MKKPTYKELEELKERLVKSEKDLEKYVFLTCILFLIGIIVLGVIMDTRYNNLSSENRELKEQIGKDTWVLNYNCDWTNSGTNFTAHYEFTNWNKYQEQLSFAKDTIKCEVLE